jgi:hypothetical protein
LLFKFNKNGIVCAITSIEAVTVVLAAGKEAL